MVNNLIKGRILVCFDQHTITGIDYFEQTTLSVFAEANRFDRDSIVHNVSSIHISVALPKKIQESIEIVWDNHIL